MLRPQRNTQIPLRYRDNSPPQIHRNNDQRKRPKIDSKNIDRNNVDQALTVIASTSECTDEPSKLISTELSHFEANYVQNRTGASRYTGLSELDFFPFFFNDSVVEILFKETNSYVEYQLRYSFFLSLSLSSDYYWVSTTSTEIRIYLDINLYFDLYRLII